MRAVLTFTKGNRLVNRCAIGSNWDDCKEL